MNLLGLLLGAMTSQSSVGEVSGKTGISEKQIKQLMLIAIPILIKFLTKNASSNDGAQSLLGALTQHTNKNEMQLQLKDADEKDGSKIIAHICPHSPASPRSRSTRSSRSWLPRS